MAYRHRPTDTPDDFGFTLPEGTQLVHVENGTRDLIGQVRDGAIYVPRTGYRYATLDAALATRDLDLGTVLINGGLRVQQPEMAERTLFEVAECQRARIDESLSEIGHHFSCAARAQFYRTGLNPDLAWHCATAGEPVQRETVLRRPVTILRLTAADRARLTRRDADAPGIRVATSGGRIVWAGYERPDGERGRHVILATLARQFSLQ